MQDVYIFPAIFRKEKKGISILFPDLVGCLPCASTMKEAFFHAKEALTLHLCGMLEDGEIIPKPSEAISISLKKNDALHMIGVHISSSERFCAY